MKLSFLLLFLISAVSCSKFNTKKQSNSNIVNEIMICANNFIGTPYDPNPIGEYVYRNTIVYDEKVDCMYFVFRCAEIALAKRDNKDPIEVALDQRFRTRGILDKENKVLNYQDRFDYADDMVTSDKWGDNVTNTIGKVSKISGSRGVKEFEYIAIPDINFNNFQTGDIIFFVKAEDKRVVGEVLAHLGFIEIKKNKVYMIHASGLKRPDTDGKVKKVLLKEYLSQTKFIGIMVKRMR
jgi:hypothetical protein